MESSVRRNARRQALSPMPWLWQGQHAGQVVGAGACFSDRLLHAVAGRTHTRYLGPQADLEELRRAVSAAERDAERSARAAAGAARERDTAAASLRVRGPADLPSPPGATNVPSAVGSCSTSDWVLTICRAFCLESVADLPFAHFTGPAARARPRCRPALVVHSCWVASMLGPSAVRQGCSILCCVMLPL